MQPHYESYRIRISSNSAVKKIAKGLVYLVVTLFFLLAPLVTTVKAASSPSYKYSNSGTIINATGGAFDADIINFTQTTTKSNTYYGEKQTSYIVPASGMLLSYKPAKTYQCIAKMEITVGSDKKSASIKTLPPGYYITATGSTHIDDCTASQAPSDFNQSSIIIDGSITDTTSSQSTYETDEHKQISVAVYSNKQPSELPQGIKATLTNTLKTVNQSWDISFVGSEERPVDQKFFKGISPDTYTVCITPDKIFNYSQCQTATKKVGAVLYMNFGSSDTVYYVDGRVVNAVVSINLANSVLKGTFGPMGISLEDTSGKVIAQASTNSVNLTGDENKLDPILLNARIDPVNPGDYKVCITGHPELCSAKFTKKINTMSSSPETQINIKADQSDQFRTTIAASTCEIDGIGWIVCPVVKFLSFIADSAFTFLSDSFLATNAKIFDTSNPTYSAWVIMRNIANVAFVIAFLIIIFSQLTGAGITNYGVKKLLPRIVVAAILVNLSYFICQIAVDLSNIFGYSLKNLLAGLVPMSSGGTAGFWSGGTWADIAGTVLAGAVGVGVVWASLASLIPVLLAAVVALVMILFILIARQALIILLIVISPLAFVVFLLPNTDQWFKKWRQTFTAMLMLFPIIALVYGVSSLASNVLSQTFSSGGTSLQETLGQIAAAAVMVLPLFAVPTLLKKSLDGVGNIGTTLNGLGSKLSKSAGNAASNSRLMQYKKSKDAQKSAMIQSGNYRTTGRFSRFNLNNLRSSLHKRFNESGVSGEYGNRELTRGFSVADAADAEVMKNANSRMDNMDFGGVPLSQAQTMQIALGQNVTDEHGSTLAKASKFDVNMRRSAIQKAAKIATVSDAQRLVDMAPSMETAVERKTLVASLAGSSALAKAPYLSGKNFGYITSGFKPEDAEADENGYKHNMIKDVDENNNPITRLMTLSEYSAAQTIRDGKIDAEALASGDANSTKMLLKVAQGSVDGAAEKQLLKAAYATLNAPESRLKEKIVAGSDKDKNIQEMGRF